MAMWARVKWLEYVVHTRDQDLAMTRDELHRYQIHVLNLERQISSLQDTIYEFQAEEKELAEKATKKRQAKVRRSK
jgi:CII-binding regulator of phage lambda lysogenization HflD